MRAARPASATSRVAASPSGRHERADHGGRGVVAPRGGVAGDAAGRSSMHGDPVREVRQPGEDARRGPRRTRRGPRRGSRAGRPAGGGPDATPARLAVTSAASAERAEAADERDVPADRREAELLVQRPAHVGGEQRDGGAVARPPRAGAPSAPGRARAARSARRPASCRPTRRSAPHRVSTTAPARPRAVGRVDAEHLATPRAAATTWPRSGNQPRSTDKRDAALAGRPGPSGGWAGSRKALVIDGHDLRGYGLAPAAATGSPGCLATAGWAGSAGEVGRCPRGSRSTSEASL